MSKEKQYEVPKWIPPPRGIAKINVDATLSKNHSIVAVAAVARSDRGDFLGASAVVMHGITEAETAEILACREGLSLASDLLVPRFRLANDCAMAIRNIQGDGMGQYGHIVREIKVRQLSFGFVEFIHKSRRSNIDAHTLARKFIASSVGMCGF
ncbi:hypothetical protein EJB05_48595, partial [Eragrostis curvula]